MDTAACRWQRQQGTVAVTAALALPVLIGFAGLALDAGHLYVEKTELQNAVDACALAASRELTCDAAAGTCVATILENAENSGLAVAHLNRADFQRAPLGDTQLSASDITFSASFASGYRSRTGGADPAAKFVKCTAHQSGILPWFMQVLGAGAQSVSAAAVASLAPAQTNCGIPIGMCRVGPAAGAPPFGLVKGNWYNGRFNSGGGITGSFNWIDFTPPSGGASELTDMLTGTGVCNLNITSPVGQSGVLGNAAAKAWNSRFGLYQSGAVNVNNAPPDFTGYAYTPVNFPSQRNALGDFLAKRGAHASYGVGVGAGNALTGLSINNSYNPTTTPALHTTKGADRRLVVAPIVDCTGWGSSQTVPIQSWACVLMLHPIDGPSDIIYLEYRGLSSDPDTPCATSGAVGGPGSVGPLVPALVQ